jgi:hypothetical protein
MIVFNTLTNTFVTGFVPDMVSEIVCDNYSFARSAYNTTATREQQDDSDFSIFPNPATSKFRLTYNASPDIFTLKIRTLSGKECLSRQIRHSETEIPTESLAKGVYVVTVQDQNSTKTKKLIIQ